MLNHFSCHKTRNEMVKIFHILHQLIAISKSIFDFDQTIEGLTLIPHSNEKVYTKRIWDNKFWYNVDSFSCLKNQKMEDIWQKPHHQLAMSLWIFDFDQTDEGLKIIPYLD